MSFFSQRSLFAFFIPLAIWILFSFWSAELDIKVSRLFYKHGNFSESPFWNWIYVYALVPGWILAGMAIIGFCLSFVRWSFLRLPCFYLILTLAIGSGAIVHGVLKEYWGRPRPKQVSEFGGVQTFRPYYAPSFSQPSEPSKSFASGHASMGFYFFSLALLGSIYRSRWIFWIGIGMTFVLGSLLSLARIAQGGHFLSDTIAAALIMWLTAYALAYLIFKERSKRSNERLNAKTK